ncbi:hypothetical protein [Massilia sp. Leaf139]|uniref:hypothetical protein n=1 Tax=Massilia sp. Leaf139 TaxID=1736272 RepID=UPI0012E97CAE|nr:hypothetical protein [Massilia sp. Leaf139]
MKSDLAWVRQGQRGIRMVAELHRMGYQLLRIMPYYYPLGWRLAIDSAEHFSLRNGAVIPKDMSSAAPVISSGGVFWEDARSDTARALAEEFVLRFPSVAARGLGRDWCYAGWLSELLGYLEGGDWLPVTEWEYMKGEPEDIPFLPIWDASGSNIEAEGHLWVPAERARRFPLPPAPPCSS